MISLEKNIIHVLNIMGKYENASQRTPRNASTDFKNGDVYVAESELLRGISTTNIEYGLFSNRTYKKGDVIQEYKGNILTDNEAEEKKRYRKYMFDVKHKGRVVHVIDAANKKDSSALRYINACLTPTEKELNTKFKQYKLKIYLVAVKDIKKDTELLAYYGEDTNGVLEQK